jgi:hypothetical protein
MLRASQSKFEKYEATGAPDACGQGYRFRHDWG